VLEIQVQRIHMVYLLDLNFLSLFLIDNAGGSDFFLF
jgi:hypothetical protein